MSQRILKFLLITFIVCTLLFSSSVEAKKKKGKGASKNQQKPDKSSSKRPVGTSPELYCNACQAIIREALKKLKHRKSESDVMETVSEICDPENYMIYEFPPPEMREGCEAFIMDWEEDVEKLLMQRATNEEVENKMCFEISEACKNVNVKDAPKFDNEIFVDGQPVPVGQDGKVDLGYKNNDDL